MKQEILQSFYPKFLKSFLFIFGVILFSESLFAQNVTVNPGAGSYPDLASAVTAINAGTHTGAVIVNIIGNTTEPAVAGAASVTLNASGTGAALYTTISIQPSGGAARTISGVSTSGFALIDLNGADNVTIDGLNTGGNSLTIQNSNALSTSGTSTIRFVGGATNNTITNCSINGSASMGASTNGGTIYFATDALTTNGNDNNTISNNDLGPVGAALPTKAIYGNGSTTTAAIGNSGNIINNNNIFDYFGAAVNSSGVTTQGGCNTWSITNNRFYQTATRTWTTGFTHRAIDVNNSTATSGAQGFTITGNVIGYASSSQTGTYTLTGSNGKFQGIYFSGITGGTVSSINNNTIASVNLTGVTSSGTGTSSPFAAVIIQNGLATSNSNTIGSQLALGSLTFSTTTTALTDVYGFYNFSLNNWISNENSIGGISVTNAGASGNFLVYGMRANTSTTVTWNSLSNLIGGTVANSIQLNATGAASQVVGLQSPNSIGTHTSNIIRNLTSNIGTGTTTSASVAGMIFTSTTPNHTISQNTIHTLTNTNASAATIVTGIQFTGGTANVVERNFIYNLLSSTTSASAEINGIRVAGGTTVYRNNMIALGAGVVNAIGGVASNSSTLGINGIMEFLGTNSFFHNSVYIGGAPSAGSGTSIAFNGSQTVNTRSFRDNIFFNGRSNSGATGKHYAVKINGTTANPTGLTLNYNVYLANGTGGVFGFFNSLDVANIAAWRTAVGQDAASFESSPRYIDPTNAIPDLHIDPLLTTVIEGNGLDVGVVLDYDGQTRSGLTPVDIGADAGDFRGIDLAAPTIVYSPLLFTCTTGDRTLTTTIADVSGVPTSGALQPRIYYRKNAGTWFSSQGVLTSGTGINGTWTMTIVAADMGGLIIGDNVQYYVIAQDVAATPNIASNPSGGLVAADVNTVTTAPTTPNNYNISSTLSGTYTVGVAGSYTTLKSAITAYNTSCLSGPVLFSLIDPSYSFTSDTIRVNPDASATNTLTIKPAVTSTITGNSVGATLLILGSDYVTIDGSIGSTVNTLCPPSSATRDLTISNSNVGTVSAVIWLTHSGADGANNNKIINCNIEGNAPTTTIVGIGSGNTIGTAATLANHNNNSYINNSFKKLQIGLYAYGISTTLKDQNTIVSQNIMNAVSPDNVSRGGITLGAQNNLTVTGNNISNISIATTVDAFGIALGGLGAGTSTTSSTFDCTNTTATDNIIGSIRQINTYSACGILFAPGASGTSTIANNMISGVSANGTGGDFSCGIFVIPADGSVTNIYYNTVTMVGTQTGGSEKSYALAVAGGTTPTLNIRNNILVNKQNNGSGVNYAMGLGYALFTNIVTNNNDLYTSTGALYAIGATSSISAPVNQLTFANWQTATAQEAASKNVDPIFISGTDLHLDVAANPMLNAMGSPVSTSSDIDCTTRDASTPDIGADEFVAVVLVPTITSLGTMAGCPGATLVINGTNLNGALAPDVKVGGTAVASIVSNTGSILTVITGAGSTGVVTVTIGPNTATGSDTYTFYAIPTAIATSMSPICAESDLNLMGTTDIGMIYSWTGPNSFSSALLNPSISAATTAASGTYTFIASLNGCSSTPAMVTVIVNPTPTAVTIAPATVVKCSTDPAVLLTATGGSLPNLPIGTGTNFTTSTGEQTAFCNRRLNYVGQTIYTAAELTAAGIEAGNITSMAYNISSDGDATTNANYTVKIGHEGSLVNFPSTAFLSNATYTTVYGPSTYTHAAPGWQVITFVSPFVWDGTSNICVDVRHDGIDDIDNAQTQFTTTPGNASLFGFNTPAAGTLSTSRFNILFTPVAGAPKTWTPTTGLFTDAAGTVAYTGTPTNTVYAAPASTQTYTVTATSPFGCTSSTTREVVVNTCNAILTTTTLIEGFMNGATMRPVRMLSGVMGATALECDEITVELRNTMTYAVAHTVIGIMDINGVLVSTFPPAAIGNSYYIAVQHRNALETWSAAPVAITATTSYNFTTAVTQAYGDNMVGLGAGGTAPFAFYSGDIDNPTGDGNVDLVDYPIWDVDFFNFESGYRQADLNGDGVVDLVDYPIWDVNFFNFVSVMKP